MQKCYEFVFDIQEDCSIAHFKSFLQAIYSIRNINTDCTFGILYTKEKFKFYVLIDEEFKNIFSKKLLTVCLSGKLKESLDPKAEQHKNIWMGMKLNLKYNDENKHLKTEDKGKSEDIFYIDLLSSLITENNDISLIEISLQNQNKKGTKLQSFCKILNEEINDLFDFSSTKSRGYNYTTKSDSTNISNICFNVNIRMLTLCDNKNVANNNLINISSVFNQISNTNQFISKQLSQKDLWNRYSCINKLSVEEIIQFLHIPDSSIEHLYETSNARELCNNNIPSSGLVIGDYNEKPLAFSFPDVVLNPKTYSNFFKEYKELIENFCKAKFIVGMPGSGKTEWLIWFIMQCVNRGFGAIIIDPKSDLQQRTIESLPDKYLDKLDFIDLGNTSYPPSFNLFRRIKKTREEDITIVQLFLSVMKKMFDAREWSTRIQLQAQLICKTILAGLETPTLNECHYLVFDDAFREYVLDNIRKKYRESDGQETRLKQILDEWAKYDDNPKKLLQDFESIATKIKFFTTNDFIGPIVSQVDGYSFRQAGDQGRITLINVPEGLIGLDNKEILSCLINKVIWLDYQSRDDIPLNQRFPVLWVIDEAHDIVDGDLPGILTKARSRRLALMLATQGLGQFDKVSRDLKTTILTNCKDKFVFTVGGSHDAADFVEEFKPLRTSDFVNCPIHYFYGRMILPNGTISDPFFAHAPLPLKALRSYEEFILANKNRLKLRPLVEIEKEMYKRIADIHTA